MSPRPRDVHVVLLALACLAAAGCHRQTAQAASPAATAPAESATPASTQPGESPAAKPQGPPAPAATTGETETTPPAKPPSLKVPEPAHTAPKPAAPAATPQPAPDTPAPRPPAPLISPRISPAQQSERRQQTEKSISVAEANLHRADGHALNDTQQDLVEKIRSFLAQAREAGEIPDWERAFVLAEKARILSQELVNSL